MVSGKAFIIICNIKEMYIDFLNSYFYRCYVCKKYINKSFATFHVAFTLPVTPYQVSMFLYDNTRL